ncbi:signal peptidase I [Petrocella sp. FN5]|uniref:signal peptidase I n=1 Tax=Petrocella sp. FN5 TaxID=3032002 RepID=UPI0023DAE91A|nr:signal peptidase I [Petrocella sp. FN5]MDF1617164.1 signal peptidase I [Petrocella sp. FN5]
MKNKIVIEIIDYLKLLFFVLVITTLLNTLVFTFSTVKQSSMETTLMENDVLVIEKISMIFEAPKQGDIVVFVENEYVTDNFFKKINVLYEDMIAKFTGNSKRMRLVKRVVGIPGDSIDIKDGYVYVNGALLDESYTEDLTFPSIIQYPLTLSEGYYFLLGDNRDVSRDSRHFGLVSARQIEGKALFRIAPLKKIGGI